MSACACLKTIIRPMSRFKKCHDSWFDSRASFRINCRKSHFSKKNSSSTKDPSIFVNHHEFIFSSDNVTRVTIYVDSNSTQVKMRTMLTWLESRFLQRASLRGTQQLCFFRFWPAYKLWLNSATISSAITCRFCISGLEHYAHYAQRSISAKNPHWIAAPHSTNTSQQNSAFLEK